MKVVAVYPIKDMPPLVLPMAASSVSAGFVSPALDHEEQPLNLSEFLVKHPKATHLVRARGDSMVGEGILDGALLVVDRSMDIRDGRIVIAVIEGDLVVKKLRIENGQTLLVAGNKRYKSITVTGEDTVWGVVAHAVNSYL